VWGTLERQHGDGAPFAGDFLFLPCGHRAVGRIEAL
jgi:hypothetical protein